MAISFNKEADNQVNFVFVI